MQIELTQGKYATVDPEYYDRLMAYGSWRFANGYAVRHSKQQRYVRHTVRMHRVVMELAGVDIDGLDIDHRNGDKLDNRIENLRTATRQENQANRGTQQNSSTGLKGVSLHKRHQNWMAGIRIDGKRRHLGYFDDPISAALAYDDAALEAFGEFAQLNINELIIDAVEA